MTATNHVTTGALIGSVIVNPWLAIPVSFFAHFVLDSLPHYDLDEKDNRDSKKFLYSLAIDCAIALSILIAIFLLAPDNWPVILASGIACASPDLMWIRYWIADLTGKTKPKLGRIAQFHSRIQRYAKHSLPNFLIEFVWFLSIMTVLLYNLKP